MRVFTFHIYIFYKFFDTFVFVCFDGCNELIHVYFFRTPSPFCVLRSFFQEFFRILLHKKKLPWCSIMHFTDKHAIRSATATSLPSRPLSSEKRYIEIHSHRQQAARRGNEVAEDATVWRPIMRKRPIMRLIFSF